MWISCSCGAHRATRLAAGCVLFLRGDERGLDHLGHRLTLGQGSRPRFHDAADHYAHCLPDTARERGADLLVTELLAGTNAGTSALPECPGASASVAGDAVEMPRKSRNVRERQGASATATEELRA